MVHAHHMFMITIRRKRVSLLSALVSVIMSAGFVIGGEEDTSTNILAQAGFTADRSGITDVLSEFSGQAQLKKKVESLLRQIQQGDPGQRRDARKELLSMPALPLEQLRRAMNREDPEVAMSAMEVLREAGPRMNQLLLATFDVIRTQGMGGLASELAAVGEGYIGDDLQYAWSSAIQESLAESDVAYLRSVLKPTETAFIREKAIEALCLRKEPRNSSYIRPYLTDKDEPVRVMAAYAFAQEGDAACLPVFLKTLSSTRWFYRDAACRMLKKLTGQNYGFKSDGSLKERELKISEWAKYIEKPGDGAKITPVAFSRTIALFNGVDLSGWQAVIKGQLADAQPIWGVKDGVLGFSGKGRGYLRTRKAYSNYRLKLEWRWPGPPGDSGVFVFVGEQDAALPNGLEIQLLNDLAGDFWLLNQFEATFNGKPKRSGRVHAKGKSNEVQPGEWNRLEVRVFNGTMEVFVNDVLRNKAEEVPKEPRKIGLQMENDPIEFRNIKLEPMR